MSVDYPTELDEATGDIPSPADVMARFNRELTGSSTGCPPKGAWGECPAISDQYGHFGNLYWIAHVHWWRTPPTPEIVRAWVEACGFACYQISHVLYEDDGADPEVNWIQWDVAFGVKDGEEVNFL